MFFFVFPGNLRARAHFVHILGFVKQISKNTYTPKSRTDYPHGVLLNFAFMMTQYSGYDVPESANQETLLSLLEQSAIFTISLH